MSLGRGRIQPIDALAEAIPFRANWRDQLPMIAAHGVILRELQRSDAASLQAHLSTREVSRFISPPPMTAQGFERFIGWAQAEREAGRYVCFAVVPQGATDAVGIFQVRPLVPSFEVAEWGFAIGDAFWGSGMFATAASRVVDFAIDTLGVRRLEARASVHNGRGTGALRKIGAVCEAVLRKGFLQNGRYQDQTLWAINADDWPAARLHAKPVH